MEGHNTLDMVCTVTCKSSKKTLLLVGHSTYTAAEWAKVLIRMLHICDWGIPARIISDRDPKFVSAIWKEIFTILAVHLLFSTAYHAQTDGQSERTNQTVEICLRYHTFSNPDVEWVHILGAIQHNINNSLAVTIGRSPNELVLGFKPRSIVDLLAKSQGKQVADETFEALRSHYQQEAVQLMDIASALSKMRYDDKHTPTEFDVGEEVYLRLGKGYHLPGKPNRKLSPQRLGPFKIIGKIGNLAYKLDFPISWKLHPVVSMAHLWRPTQGNDPFGREAPRPGPVKVDGQEEFEIERLVDHRVEWRGKSPTIRFLIRWKGWEQKYDNWESRQELMANAREMVEEYEAKNPIDLEALIKERQRKREEKEGRGSRRVTRQRK